MNKYKRVDLDFDARMKEIDDKFNERIRKIDEEGSRRRKACLEKIAQCDKNIAELEKLRNESMERSEIIMEKLEKIAANDPEFSIRLDQLKELMNDPVKRKLQ